MTPDPRWPLGEPLNRAQPPKAVPAPGRPNWFTDGKGGAPFYVDPAKPAQGAQ